MQLSRLKRGSDVDTIAPPIRQALTRFDASECLWTSGHRADGLRLGLEALDLMLDACRRVLAEEEESPENTDLGPALDRLFLSTRDRIEILSVRAPESLPDLDSEINEAHVKLQKKASRAFRRLAPPMKALLREPWQVHFDRVFRALSVISVLIVVSVVAYRKAFPPPRIDVSSSEDMGHWVGARAFDGNEATEWLLHDHHRNHHLDFELVPPRNLEAIEILNAHNPPHNDRATKNYRIELTHESSREPTIIRGEFAEFTENPQWRRVDLEDQHDVVRVRFVVETVHGQGGGLAELRLIEASQ